MIKNIKKSPDNLTKKRPRVIRVIRMIKSQKSKSYFFEEKIVIADHINNFFQKKSK